MHILFVVPYTPNLIRTRPYNLIRHLHQRGHRLTLLTLFSNEGERNHLEVLAQEGITVISEPLSRGRSLANSLAALAMPDPVQSAYCWQPALARQLELALEGAGRPPVDVVHVEHLRGARYALHAKSVLQSDARAAAIPVVWDSVDCISYLFRQAAAQSATRFGRWITRLELPRTERYEGRLAWEFDAVLTTSAVDQAALVELAAAERPGRPPIHVVPNGVDLDYFRPNPAVVRDPATLVLSGKMSYHANVTMAVYLVREIMPLVWAERPDTRVVIVGKDPSAAVQALAEHPAVSVTGSVPDIRPYLRQATIAVAPVTYGAGNQNKVLEALACATPVVATAHAAAALPVVPERDLLTGRDAPDLAAAILSLLDDPDRRAAFGSAGRAAVECHCDWSAIAGQLVELHEQARRGEVRGESGASLRVP